jgi:hypothetical protein
MKKIIFFLVVISVATIGASFVEAAPAPWGIALNAETKECAGFWPGDEFVDYALPSGWKSYFPKYDPETKITTLETEIGSCDFKIREEEKCCQELGYSFVSDNIGKDQKTILRDREKFEKALEKKRNGGKNSYAVPIVITLLVLTVIILLVKWVFRRKKKEAKENNE